MFLDSRGYASTILLTLVIAVPVFAQTAGPEVNLLPVPEDEKQVQFRKIYASDGLPENTPLSIMQDREGYMWFGTLNGLARFDGTQWKVYKHNPADSTSLPNAVAQVVIEDSRGTIWVASGGYVSRLDPLTDRFARIDPDPDFDWVVSKIFEDSGGTLWISSRDPATSERGSLTRLDPVTGHSMIFRHDPSDPTTLPAGSVGEIVEAADGGIWVAVHSGGLVRIDPRTNRTSTLRHDPADPTSLGSDLALALHMEDGHLWVGLGGVRPVDPPAMLARVDPATGEVRNFLLDPPATTVISRIIADQSGALWISTLQEGLYRFDKGSETFSVFRHDPLDENSLSRDGIWDLHLDRSGLLWVGTWNHGLNQLDLSSSRFYHIKHNPQDPNSIGPGQVEGLFEDIDGAIWIATDGGGVTRYDRTSGIYRRFVHDPSKPYSLPSNRTRTIYRDRRGVLWITTIDGLAYLDEGTGRFHSYRHDPADLTSLANNGVQTVLEDTRGNFWVATYGGGLNLLDRRTGKFKHFKHIPGDTTGLSNDEIMVVFEDSRARVWVGTNGEPGLHLMNPETGTFRSDFPGFFSSVTHIAESGDGALWVGNFTGIFRLDPDSLTARWFPETEGIDSETIAAIVEDDQGFLWISTDRGLSRLDPRTNTFRNFTAADIGHTVFFENRAGFRSKNGPLFFGGGHGITFFYPDQLLANPHVPGVLLTDVRLFNRSIREGDDLNLRKALLDRVPLRLRHDQNHLGFTFSAAHYSRPERNLYSYKLDGYDEEWSEPSNLRQATYTNLSPGRYTFRVRAANPDGLWNDVGASVSIYIAPPWWQTPWAYVSYVLLLALGIFAVDRFQRRRLILRERQRARVQQAELRAGAAEAQSRALEAENDRKRNVELLSEIGRQITSTLAVDEIIDTVYARVNELMDANTFGIGIADEARGVLEFPATWENGVRLAPYYNRLDDDNRVAVRCFTRREEIVVGDWSAEHGRYVAQAQAPVAGDDTSSLIYLPLVFKDRAIGVITAQSFEKHAYSAYHTNLLRNLAIYAAIAIDNAEAYRRLENTLEHLTATQQQLVTQEKLASLGALTAGIAHEIKNPLNFVNNFAELNRELTEELRIAIEEGDSDIADLLDNLIDNATQIAKHGKRADGIVRNMMEHARGGSSTLQQTEINELVEEYVDLAFHGRRAQAPGSSVRIERSLDPSVGSVAAMPQDLGRVILNLISNAFDALEEQASKRGGLDGYQPTVRVSTARSNGRVEIRVEDNGPGIPEHVRERIFEPFFTTKPTGSGTGLGLSLSYDIITKGHGGTLRLETPENGGALFLISLPSDRL